jgi:hypothetical protein
VQAVPACGRLAAVGKWRRVTMQVGYLGVGNMGQPMAEKLLDGGHGLVVYDISEAAMEPLLLRQARRAIRPRKSPICARSSPCRCRPWRPFAPLCWDQTDLPPAAR